MKNLLDQLKPDMLELIHLSGEISKYQEILLQCIDFEDKRNFNLEKSERFKTLNMDLKLEIYECLCRTSIFTINGVNAHYDDFGEKYDRGTENTEDYECDDMRFTGKDSTPEILTKYSITQTEYDDVVSLLSEKLSFGSCSECI